MPPNRPATAMSPGPVRVLQLGSPMGLYGAERWIIALVKHLSQERISSMVAAIKDAPDLAAPLCAEARQWGVPGVTLTALGRFNLSAVARLRRFLVRNRIDILHTHGYKQDIIGLLATRGTPCRLVSTPHGWSVHADFKLWCYEKLNRAIFPFFDAVCPLSADIYRPLARVPGLRGKLRLITNAVDLSEIEAARAVHPAMAAWRGAGYPVIGYIGQLIPRKRLDRLLTALAGLESLPWRLAIVGEGESRAALEALAERLGTRSRVRFFGYCQNRLDFLRGFDCFVLPSVLEGIPRCLMEAMAANVPVVASDIPGCRDLVAHGKTGLLFPVNQPGALTRAVGKVIGDSILARRLADNAQAFVQRKFSMVRMAGEYEDLYLSLVGAG